MSSGIPGKPEPAEAAPPDLLPLIYRAGILTVRQFEEIRAKVQGGDYPRDPAALAGRLVVEQILTEFQAGRLLRNKAHGLVIGRYVVLDRLGAGAMGRVFKAQHRLMGRVVALKLIAPQIARRANSVARFQREMRLVGRLDDPNVVRAFDADQVGDVLYIVMEFVDGRSLELVLQERGPLPPAEVIEYIAQAALGLAHAHDQGIIHRDVKPSNLLLDTSGRVKVLDLGLGALMEGDSCPSFATAAGVAVGTADYMAPELACGRDADGRSDLFGLGCTMYRLLTDRLPFPGATILECLQRRVEGRPVPILEVRPDVPPGLIEVLEKLLARRPEDRYQTGTEAAEALRALLRDETAIPGFSSADASRGPAPGTVASTRPALPAGPFPAPPGEPPHPAPGARARLPILPAGRLGVRGLLILLVLGFLILALGFVLGFLAATLSGADGPRSVSSEPALRNPVLVGLPPGPGTSITATRPSEAGIGP